MTRTTAVPPERSENPFGHAELMIVRSVQFTDDGDDLNVSVEFGKFHHETVLNFNPASLATFPATPHFKLVRAHVHVIAYHRCSQTVPGSSRHRRTGWCRPGVHIL